MATAHTRPAGSYSPTETTNANKYVTDSGSSTAISSLKVDADFNYIIDALNNLSLDIDAVVSTGLPTQTGNADKFLTTDGSIASWAKVDTANIEDGAITTAKILDNNVTLAKLAGGTAGALIGFDASGDPAETAVGTSGQVLTSNGAGAVPTMQSLPASGSLVFISETVISGTPSSVDITSGIDSTYDSYLVDIVDLIPASNNTALYFRVTTDGGSTFKSGASDYWFHGLNTSSTSSSYSSNAIHGYSEIWLGAQIGNGASEGIKAHLLLHNPSSSATKCCISYQGVQSNSTSLKGVGGAGLYNAATAVDGFRLLMSSGNLTSGTIRLYGIKKS